MNDPLLVAVLDRRHDLGRRDAKSTAIPGAEAELRRKAITVHTCSTLSEHSSVCGSLNFFFCFELLTLEKLGVRAKRDGWGRSSCSLQFNWKVSSGALPSTPQYL